MLNTCLFAQEIAIGQWRVHLPYNNGKAVAVAGKKVYCAAKTGLFYYDKDDASLNRLSKIDGLSDIEINKIAYNQLAKTLLIAYSSTNIDLITEDNIINVSDLLRKQVLGNKTINNVYMNERYAYLACGFGIVVFDLIKKEFKDTYYIGTGGSAININEVALTDDRIFAASDSGVYSAPKNGVNLLDYNNWTRETISSNSKKKFNTIATLNNNVYANYNSAAFGSDTIYVKRPGSSVWTYLDSTNDFETYKISTVNNKLFLSHFAFIQVLDASEAHVGAVAGYQDAYPLGADIDSDGRYWVADASRGLVYTDDLSSFNSMVPNGPATANAWSMHFAGTTLYVAPGYVDGSWNNVSYNRDSIFKFKDGNWETLGYPTAMPFDSARDVLAVTTNPSNDNDVFVGSWFRGVFEMENGEFKNQYNPENSTIQNQVIAPTYRWYGVGGLAFDPDGNLWVGNASCTKQLSVKKPDGTWKAFALTGLGSNSRIGKVVVASNGYKWIQIPLGGGFCVYNENKTIDDESDDKVIILNSVTDDEGTRPIDVWDYAEDEKGDIWVGTDKGVYVAYSPSETIFSSGSIAASRIKVDLDGYIGYLLESEIVTAVTIDKANRKWLGTKSSGVFLMSEDGTKELEHFNVDNSPILSNNITCISINNETGEVFFGTDRGIISYKGTATEGKETCNDLFAYPNPVKPDYEGVIAIRGMLTNSVVKITDVSGNLIYETKALGGQAIWNGKNLKGDRVSSGVYFAFCADNDGKKKCFTKIVVIK